MTDIKMNGTRRAFFLSGGAVLGASVATTAAAAALLPHTSPAAPDQLQALQRQLAVHQDRDAIRQLHLAFTGAIERQAFEAAAELFDSEAALDLSGLSALGKPAILRQFVTQYRQQQAPVLHGAYRHSPLHRQDQLDIAADGLQATATFHCDVEIRVPLRDDSTLAQMARLQGHVAERRWESGCFKARYAKTDGQWKIAALGYSPV